MRIFISTIFMLFLFGSAILIPAVAEIYMWTDEEGVVHFSDSQVAETEPYEVIKTNDSGSSDAVDKALQAIYEPYPNGETGVQILDTLSFDGTKESLLRIQKALLPAVKGEGNCMALALCRQTCHALGQEMALQRKDGVPKTLAKRMDSQTANAWYSKVRQKAMAGDPFFQTNLAIWYISGSVLPNNNPPITDLKKDFSGGLSLLLKASEAGYWDATHKLGQIYVSGNGVRQDDRKAFDLFMQACDQGSVPAAYNVGISYAQGKGVTKNVEKAMDYWEKAAKQGHVLAQFNYGINYCEGHGVPRNVSKGKPWLIKAAHQKYRKAIEYCHSLNIPMDDLYQEVLNTGYEKKSVPLNNLVPHGH